VKEITPNTKGKEMSANILTRKRLLREAHTKSLVEAFIEEFQDVLVMENPTVRQVKQVFDWLRQEGKCAVSFSEINALNKCRRMGELSFSKFEPLKTLTWNESKSVGRGFMKRFEELRTIRKSTRGRLPIFEGHREEEKALPQQ
jgi:hypothetical protein